MYLHSHAAAPRLRRAPLWTAAAALTLVLLLPVAWAGAAPATIGGVLAEGDGSGVRLELLVSGPFHYFITAHADSIVISLDGVLSEKLAYRFVVGPVTGVLIRPRRSRMPRVDVVVTTRTPLVVVGESVDDHALILRLAPHHAVAHLPPYRPASTPASRRTWMRSCAPNQTRAQPLAAEIQR
jgi:hypothetical protein